MVRGRPMPPLVLGEADLQQLESMARSRSLPHALVQRAQIVLACAAGHTNQAVAQRLGLAPMTVGKWRQRYRQLGLQGLQDEPRSGRPRTYTDNKVAEVLHQALETTPADGSGRWTARSLAAATGISKSTVHRWLQTLSQQPPRQPASKRISQSARTPATAESE